MYKKLILSAAILVGTMQISATQAAQPSATARQHASQIASSCPGQWDGQICLKAVSEATMVMASTYGEVLQEQKHDASAENLKQHCAAATAASQGVYPAEAMRSAFTECANTMSDISNDTQIMPDPSLYQLLVGAVLCLDKDKTCANVESGLKQY